MRNFYLLPLFWAFCALPENALAQQSTLVAASAGLSGAAPAAGPNAGAIPSQQGAADAATTGAVVYNVAEEMPAFAGGPAAFAQFMRRTLQYPEAALAANISGKVYVRFIVAEDGRLLNPEIVKGLGYGLDQEALRLVRLMPWWTPGKIAGQPVRVRYILPLVFRAL